MISNGRLQGFGHWNSMNSRLHSEMNVIQLTAICIKIAMILTFLVISLHFTQRKVSAFCWKCSDIMISNGRLQDFGHDETEWILNYIGKCGSSSSVLFHKDSNASNNSWDIIVLYTKKSLSISNCVQIASLLLKL